MSFCVFEICTDIELFQISSRHLKIAYWTSFLTSHRCLKGMQMEPWEQTFVLGSVSRRNIGPWSGAVMDVTCQKLYEENSLNISDDIRTDRGNLALSAGARAILSFIALCLLAVLLPHSGIAAEQQEMTMRSKVQTG